MHVHFGAFGEISCDVLTSHAKWAQIRWPEIWIEDADISVKEMLPIVDGDRHGRGSGFSSTPITRSWSQ